MQHLPVDFREACYYFVFHWTLNQLSQRFDKKILFNYACNYFINMQTAYFLFTNLMSELFEFLVFKNFFWGGGGCYNDIQ